MFIEKNLPLNLLICESCRSTGQNGWRACSQCGGLGLGMMARGHWLYWGFPLTRYHLALHRSRQIFNRIRVVTVALVAINFWFWFGWALYEAKSIPTGSTIEVLEMIFLSSPLFWLGALTWLYFWYRIIRQKR